MADTTEKWILIVDDEEPILSVLMSSLKRLGSEYQVVTATNGKQAIEQLEQRPFDLLVTDYRMAGMDGLELLQTARALQPDLRTILMTAYGSEAVEKETKRLKAFRYVNKPLEINTFRQIVADALSNMAINRPGLLILSDVQYLEITRLLQKLQADVCALCVILTDLDGRLVAQVGQGSGLPLEAVASLLGGGIATLIEAGRVIDGDADSTNLAYRQGKRENLYAMNVGINFLLIMAFNRGPFNCTLRSIWFFAQRAAAILRQKLCLSSRTAPHETNTDGMEQAVDNEFDRLVSGSTQVSEKRTDAEAYSAEPGAKREVRPNQPPLLGFEEAVSARLVTSKKQSEDGRDN